MDGNNSWMMENAALTKREAWLHEAELYRLERLALSVRPQRIGLFTRLLYHVGRRMEAWGARLEERYHTAGELNDIQPASAGDCG